MSIETRHRADGDAYYVVRFRVNGKSRSKTFARRTDARRFDAGTQHSLNNGTYIPPRLGKMTLEAFANDWMNQQSCSGSTRAKYRSLLDARIVPGLGSLTLDEVTPARINTFLHDLATELAPSTVTTIASLLSSLALSAVDNERIKRTFMPRRLSLPRAQADRRVFLTSGQVDRLVDAAEARDKALIFTAAWTGLRWGELAGLRTERVDLDKRTIEVRETLVDVSGHLSLEAPKTAHSRRTVALTAKNVCVLRDHLATYPPGNPWNLVFRSPHGSPLRDDTWRRRTWKPLVESVADIPNSTRFHDLRHSHVSLCNSAGMNLKSISVRVGHSSVKVTADRYMHIFSNVHERDLAALDAL